MTKHRCLVVNDIFSVEHMIALDCRSDTLKKKSLYESAPPFLWWGGVERYDGIE